MNKSLFPSSSLQIFEIRTLDNLVQTLDTSEKKIASFKTYTVTRNLYEYSDYTSTLNVNNPGTVNDIDEQFVAGSSESNFTPFL